MFGLSWRLPHPPLRSRVLATNAAALAAVIAVASAAGARLPLSGSYPWKAAAVFTGIVLLAVGRIGRHHPFARFGPGNLTTTLRAVLVSLVAGLVGEPGVAGIEAAAAAITLAVTILDGVDGWLARRSRMISDFGARFDMEVDALLILVLSVLVWQYGKAGPWVLLSGLLRYAFVVAGWLLPWLARPLTPRWRRQAICVVQIAGLNLAIVPAVSAPASAWLAAIALVALVYSFAADVAWLWRASEEHAEKPDDQRRVR